MFYVYILKSISAERFYIGHSANLEQRIRDHNRGKVRSTKAYIPWQLEYKEKYLTKSEAYRRELQIKSYKSGSAFKQLLEKSSQ